ncbi:hypothetical protein EVA_17000 [gut metagenome]|uniref:Uncharacterized protein n=1 Tax=gut metagenome TaxID=749906 RepID=J9FKD2_9ZZZZ
MGERSRRIKEPAYTERVERSTRQCAYSILYTTRSY